MQKGGKLGTSGIHWLHISDLHLGEGGYSSDRVTFSFLNSLPELLRRSGPIDAIFVTGDIVYSGQPKQYERATEFFEALLVATQLKKENLFVVPGNHDVDRKLGKGLLRTLGTQKEADNYFEPSSALDHIVQRQTAFVSWYNEFFAGIRQFPSNTTCAVSPALAVGDESFSVLQLNTAIFSFDDADLEKLWLGRRCLEVAVKLLVETNAVYRIALMHHPIHWLSRSESTNIKTILRENCDAILNGHLHETDAEFIVGIQGRSAHLAAGAIYQDGNYPLQAMFGSLAKTELRILPIRYEDKPKAVWTIDTSQFPTSEKFEGVFQLGDSATITNSSKSVAKTTINTSSAINSGSASSIRAEFESDLFVSPARKPLYAEPRLFSRAQEWDLESDNSAHSVSIEEISLSESSYIIESRVEYGGTTLCKRIELEFSNRNIQHVFRRDARTLPNYRKKLEDEFPLEAKSDGASILVIDNYDFERDEKLLRELIQTRWFRRFVVVTTNRGNRPGRMVDPAALMRDFTPLYLWTISRNDVRGLASAVFDSNVDVFISSIVDKVYQDLLALCIPLTPANVIMYLRILHREGDFHPLNRVDIVGRYLAEMVIRPSDLYRDTFNSKNRLDVLSAFAHAMYAEKKRDFDDLYWHNFIASYQKRTLTEFDGAIFLNELLEARVLIRFGQQIFFRYRFFFEFFVGRHIALGSDLLAKFLNESEYLRMKGTIDVITGINSENTVVIETLVTRLESVLSSFASKYIKAEFDPLSKAIWPEGNDEEEKIWKPVVKELNAPSKTGKEIDLVKSSLVAEAMTSDQRIQYNEFIELEVALFFVEKVLIDALRNADDIDGTLKLRSLDAILRSHLVALQIGTVFAEQIAKGRFFRWGGVGFIDFSDGKEFDGKPSGQVITQIVTRLNASIAGQAAEDIGTKKLGAVFRARERDKKPIGFLEYTNFNCILGSKSTGWELTLQEMIERTDKNSYYLLCMLNSLMTNFESEISLAKDKDKIKKLVALIQAKRSWKKQNPGARAIDRALGEMEKQNFFSKKDETKTSEGK